MVEIEASPEMPPVAGPEDAEISIDFPQGQATDKQGTQRHACHCGKSFVRKEHLRRHQATHGLRSFICNICQRSFNRNDVLQRHISRHSTNAPPDARRGRACDVCFANKTKCDGGARCSLCTRRGVDCQYTRDTRRQMTPPTDACGNLNDSFGFSNFESSAIQKGLGDNLIDGQFSNELEDVSVAKPKTRTMRDLVHALVNAPTGGESMNDIFREIKELADCPVENNLPKVAFPDPVYSQISVAMKQPEAGFTVRTLSTTDTKLYFNHFHSRWPILHAKSFGEEKDPFVITATVCMIKAWIEASPESKQLALTIHDRLMNHLCQKMTATIEDRKAPWPVPTYQACILNIIFALYTGKERLISRAILLRALFVTVLRETEFFRSDSSRQRGGFKPFIYILQESRKRVSTMLFKIDAYFSVLRSQAPIVDREELWFKLPSTFALWDSPSLYEYRRRQFVEPAARAELDFSITMSSARSFLPVPLIIEDIQLGLCSVGHAVWKNSEFVHRGHRIVDSDPNSQKSIQCRLKAWKSQLDKVVAKLEEQNERDDLTFPLAAYLGMESTEHAIDREIVTARVASLVFETRMFYILLSLHIHADMRTLKIAAGTHAMHGPRDYIGLPSIDEQETQIRAWVSGKDGKMAIWHSFAIFELATAHLRNMMTQPKADEEAAAADPITKMAIAFSSLVVWAYLFYTPEVCNCASGMDYMDAGCREIVGLADGPELDSWLRTGGKSVAGGTCLCRSNLDTFMGEFAALMSGSEAWEIGSIIAPIIRNI